MNAKDALKVINSMRLPNGVYTASLSDDYDYVWIRDIVYTVLPFMYQRSEQYEKAYHAMLDLFLSYEWKIDYHTKHKPNELYEYIHSRYSRDLKEIDTPWGHAQNDAIGAFLWGVGEGIKHGQKIIRTDDDLRIIQKLVSYLACLEYWQCKDNGMWEEKMEIHASSVGASVAGLEAVRTLVYVEDELIEKGKETLKRLLPRESEEKETDLALLSLIFPYQVVDEQTARKILQDVTGQLEREYGVIRYKNDVYYNEGSEAEWCFGFPWLGLCYEMIGENELAQSYVDKTKKIVPLDWRVPELYVGGTNRPNGNTPLAWAVSMSYLFLSRFETK